MRLHEGLKEKVAAGLNLTLGLLRPGLHNPKYHCQELRTDHAFEIS